MRKTLFDCQPEGGGSAHAAFSANGGTLAPNRSTDSFFYAFDSAKLGTDGLTLALGDFDVTLGQQFVNEDGADGTLAKTGSGTLTLNGEAAASTFSVLELKEGVAAFAAGVSAFAPTIAVDAQARLDVSNLGDALDFGGLTLGSAQGMGFLKCKTTQTIALSTVSVVRAGLILSDVHTAGTYPLLRAPTASVDAATVDAWWTSSVMGGRQDGLCYTFTTAADGDYTVLRSRLPRERSPRTSLHGRARARMRPGRIRRIGRGRGRVPQTSRRLRAAWAIRRESLSTAMPSLASLTMLEQMPTIS